MIRKIYVLVAMFQMAMFGGLVFAALTAPHSARAAEPIVWIAQSLEFVMQDTAPGSTAQATIKAAKGETESFQIAIKGPTGGLTNVNVTPATLTGPDGAVIGTANMTLYREHYVPVNKAITGGTNKSLGPGMYPDGLIPFVNPATGADLSGTLDAAPFSVAQDKNAVVWVDASVPRTAVAGAYAGTFTVTSTQGSVSVPVTLNVWNFTLPLKPALSSEFLFDHGDVASHKEFLKNRLMPESVNSSDERSLIDRYGLKSVDLGFWSGADQSTCAMSAAPSVSSIQSRMSQHLSDLELYNYSADEISGCSSLNSTVIAWGNNLHQAGAKNKQLIVMRPSAALMDDGTGRPAVDIFVILPKQYAASDVQMVKNKGGTVWSYNTLEQDGYSPKWVVGYAPINWRIQPGFINQSLDLTGLLYWRVDRWCSDPWNNISCSNNSPGDGIFTYPGDQVGLPGTEIPSIRVKWLRDGADDYDYIELLKQKGDGAWALSLARTIGPDWTNWTRDTDKLQSVRDAIGNRLTGGMDNATIEPVCGNNIC